MTSAERNRQAAVLIWSSLIVVTVLLLSRRVSGGINGIVSVWPCVLVSSLTTLLSGCGWVSFQTPAAVRSIQATRIAAVVAWLPTWLSGIALLPADSTLARGWPVGIAALSAAMMALSSPNISKHGWEDLVKSHPPKPHTREIGHVPEAVGHPLISDRLDIVVRTAPETPSDLAVFDPVADERSDESTTQWMTRQLLPDGTEQIEGAIRVCFATGQRAASVHVPFSPPFAAVPQIECETVGGEPVRWKLSVAYAYGMRVDLKRGSSEEPEEIELSYSATCESTASEAA